MADHMEVVDNSLEQILHKLQRDINSLSEDNKTTRRRSIEKIKKEIVSLSSSSPSLLHQLLEQSLLKPLLKLFTDPVEKCRELSISVISHSVGVVSDPTCYLPLIVPVIVARLGTQDITEPSEEVRLLLVELLVKLLKLCCSNFVPYYHDMVTILRYTLLDPHPLVKKESCDCVILLASYCSSVFHQESELIVKSIVTLLNHQHSKVRVASLKALGSAIQYGSASSINDCLSSLAQRVCDNNTSVRLCTFKIIGDWLLDLPDRYSYHHKLIPLLLTGLNDEVIEIKETVHKMWTQIGTKYEQENENDLKDKMDFANLQDPFPQLNFPRPLLGCRILVYRNFSKILPAILHDLTDWTVQCRIKSSSLLYTLLYHLEDYITQHIQPVLTGLYKGCTDEEREVVMWVCHCAQVIGYYVPTDVWCHLLLPAVRVSGGVPNSEGSTVPVGQLQCTGCLMTLCHLIKGTSTKEDSVQSYLKDIALCLVEPELLQTSYDPLLVQLEYCVSSIIDISTDVTSLSLHLFIILLRLLYITDNASTVLSVMMKLSTEQSVTSLYSVHANSIITNIKGNYKNWTLLSPDYMLFSSLVRGHKEESFNDDVIEDIIAIISYYTHPDKDSELRLKFITLLIQCVLNTQVKSSFLPPIITNIIIPCCVWKAGRTAAAIRTAALTGAQVIMTSITSHDMEPLLEQFLPQLLSCLDDDNTSTRLVSCKVLDQLLVTVQFTVDSLHQLYSHLFKRLDDSCDEIRYQTTLTLMSYYKSFPLSNYDVHLYKGHLEVMYSTLLIHLDDPSTDMQCAIGNVLKTASQLHYSLCAEMIVNVKDKHRTAKYCNEIIDYIGHNTTTSTDSMTV